MARGKKSETSAKPEKSWFSRLKLMIAGSILSGGLGLGGYEFRDHPVLAAIVRFLTGQAKPGDGTLVKAIVEEAGAAAKKAKEFASAGTFEVNLKRISLDPATVGSDRSPELRAVVVRYGDDGRRQVVWQSKNASISRGGGAGDSDSDSDAVAVVASFEEPAFEIPWQPGDRLVVEIWERRLLRGVKLFERADASQEKFPLAPGDYPLKLVASGGRGEDPGRNILTVDAKRKADEADESRRVARDEGESPRTRR
jgi:hypothetical protein